MFPQLPPRDRARMVYKKGHGVAGLGILKTEIDTVVAELAAEQVTPLPLPLGVCERLINWRYVAAVGLYHVLALLAFLPWFYSGAGAVLAFVGVYVYGAFGMNLGYHRL